MCHLADNVLDVGPMWSYDCFTYENINGRIAKLIHGTQQVDKQILRAISTLHKLLLCILDLLQLMPQSADIVRDMVSQPKNVKCKM